MSSNGGGNGGQLNGIDDRINIRGYFERILQERDKVDLEREKRLDERFQAQETAVQFALTEREKAVNAALTAAKEAVSKAEDSAKETMKSHNGLIDQMRERDSTYATQADIAHVGEALKKLENFQSRILGALVLLSIAFPAGYGVIFYLFTH